MTKTLQMSNTRVGVTLIAIIVAAGLMLASPAFAETSVQTGAQVNAGPGMGFMMHRAQGVVGVVTAVSGNTLTITSKVAWKGDRDTDDSSKTPQTYTVDATNATVYKAGATSTVSAIVQNDTVMVEGTVNGTSITATIIRDGIMAGPGKAWAGGIKNGALQNIHGNGQPLIGGTVSAVSGSTITVTTKTGPSYTVDASGATFVKQGASSTIANIAVNDSVLIQGTVNGTSVTATSVIDQGVAPAAGTSTRPFGGRGIFGFLGGLFHSLFGFF